MNSEKPNRVPHPSLYQRIIRSIFPQPLFPKTERQRHRFLLRNLPLHFRPATVPEKTLRLSLSWGLGGMTAVLVLLQIGTGVLLKFIYEPTPLGAYASVQTIIQDVPFGRLIRNLHHWAAHLLVLMAFLYLLRIFFTGAFHAPRQFNWVVGLCLFGTILAANVTGYLLPWDQLAFWAVTVATGMVAYIPVVGPGLQEVVRGGDAIGPATLSNFFAVHTALIPIFLTALMAFHFWRIRRAGGLVIPRLPEEPPDPNPVRLTSVPNLLLREVTVALVLIALLVLAASLIDAPLEGPANPGLSPNPTRAPWYFAGIQELLLHLHPAVAVCAIPFLIGIGLVSIPYMPYDGDTGGIWFSSRLGRRTAVAAAVFGSVGTILLIAFGEWLSAHDIRTGISSLIGSGLMPVALLLVAMAAYYSLLRRRYAANRNEAVQAVFVMLVAAYGVLTITSVWFRGEGMTLRLPW